MARRRESDDLYRRGDHWLIDDRSGFQIRKSEAVKEWDGSIVHRDDAEERHPQEYVRARADRQAVTPTRPEPPAIYKSPRETTVASATTAGSIALPLLRTNGFDIGDRIIVYLENGETHMTTISDGSQPILDDANRPILDADGEIIYDAGLDAIAGSVYLLDPLPWPVAAGAMVSNYTDTPALEEGL